MRSAYLRDTTIAGLGRWVPIGVGQLDMTRAAAGGVGVVLLAIVIDRITQGFGGTRQGCGQKHPIEAGPIGAVRSLLARTPKT